MASEYPLVQMEGGRRLHTKSILEKYRHPVGETASQQNRIGEVDRSYSTCQCGNCAGKYLDAELKEILFIFQWYSLPPIWF